MKPIEEEIGELLRKLGATIAVAESCTGGLIAHRITSVSGSSDYFESAIVVYSNRAKEELLGIPASLIDSCGPVSEPVAGEMAAGIRQNRKTTLGLATTGVAGPLGGTLETPVGTVFIGFSSPEGTIVREYQFSGDRTHVKEHATEKALEMVREYAKQEKRHG
jgi:PncC family amidohydrolase